MGWKPDEIGHGYNDCMIRVEHRPSKRPHTKEELLEILDALHEAGVEAWWYSVSAKGSYPLFPSKSLPYSKDAAVDYYPWLVEEAHKRGIVIFSWEYLNTAPLLMEKHPDWRVKFLEGPSTMREDHPRHARRQKFACFNSPYGELLKEFCVEVVNDLGFDGIWFDGCYQYAPADEGYQWTCCCERCAAKFKDATGMDIPGRVDWKDPVFPEYLKWRYNYFMDYWKELADYVRERNNTALIAYNYFNRHYMGAVSGSPLARRNMDALIAGEGTVMTLQMQVKTLRAVSGKYPPEVWTSLHDGVKLSYPSRPNPEPASAVFYAQTAAAAGGYASFGLCLHPKEYTWTLKKMSGELSPLRGCIGGEPVKMCGLVFSGMTKDFACEPVPGQPTFAGKNKPVVNNVYGAGFMLNALHYPFEIVFDDQLGELDDYKMVVLPDVQCMSDDSAEKLEKYVRSGGVLAALGECGTKTPDGRPRQSGVLDSLFGIKKRYGNIGYCVLEPESDLLRKAGLPGEYMISGMARLLETGEDAVILARGRAVARRAAVADHDRQTEESGQGGRPADCGETSDTGVAICERKIGAGRAVYIAPAIGLDYSQNPNIRSREVFRLSAGEIELPYTVQAPAGVVVTAWRKDGKLIFHILNQPPTMLRMLGFSIALNPEDFNPAGPVDIYVPGNFTGASSPYPGFKFDCLKEKNGTRIKVPLVGTHAVVVLS